MSTVEENVELCEFCGTDDECYEDCECDGCLERRAEEHQELMRDTYD